MIIIDGLLALNNVDNQYNNINPTSRNYTESSINTENGLNIYIKSINYINNEIAAIEDEIKKSREELEKKAHYTLQYSQRIIEIKKIIKEFIKAFNINDTSEHIEIFNLFFSRFNYIDDKLDYILASGNLSEIKNIRIILIRIQTSLEKCKQLMNE